MLIERSMDPRWLSNAYLVGDEPGGTAVFVDSGAPLEPLVEAVESERLTPTHVLVTHGHHDHVAGNEQLARRFAIPIVADSLATGGLRVQALPTPGHSPDMVAFLINETVCFTGDTLFRGSVGGTRDAFEALRHSVMDVLMRLPPETRILPGHTDESTIGHEWEENPFVRVWRGVDPEGDEPCRVDGKDATLVLLASDYDGGRKAWVRFPDGRDAIVGGSKLSAPGR